VAAGTRPPPLAPLCGLRLDRDRAQLRDLGRPREVAEEAVAQLRRAALAPVSISEPVGDGEAALEELLGDGGAGDPAPGVDEAEHVAPRWRRSAAARRIVELRYGIGGECMRTLAEVAGEVGVSPERARQLEGRTLRRLSASPELRALRTAA
jgi:DNA-directed RNA polymerase sigma subunit (sigma70/sigma32)